MFSPQGCAWHIVVFSEYLVSKCISVEEEEEQRETQ